MEQKAELRIGEAYGTDQEKDNECDGDLMLDMCSRGTESGGEARMRLVDPVASGPRMESAQNRIQL